MKKILNISVIAALAVLPLAANATPVAGAPTTVAAENPAQGQDATSVTATTPPKYQLAEANSSADGKVATAGYVKGAYNAAIKAINRVSETASNALTANGTATLTNKTIDADDNTISDLEADNFKEGVVRTSTATGGGVRAVANAEDDKLVTEKAVATAIDGMVTETGTQTLTNKTIDGDDNTIQDLGFSVFKSGVVVDSTTGIAAASSASDSKLVTEKAAATAIEGSANTATYSSSTTYGNNTVGAAIKALETSRTTQGGVENTIETATITANVPTVTTWGTDATGTIGIESVSISATYAEPTPTPGA